MYAVKMAWIAPSESTLSGQLDTMVEIKVLQAFLEVSYAPQMLRDEKHGLNIIKLIRGR